MQQFPLWFFVLLIIFNVGCNNNAEDRLTSVYPSNVYPKARQIEKQLSKNKKLNPLWPDKFIVEEGVGLRGLFNICDDSRAITNALGRPTEVDEVDNVWDGKIDDYEYSQSTEAFADTYITVRVKKRTKRIIAINLSSHVDWITSRGIKKGDNLFDLERIYKKKPYEEYGFLSTIYKIRGLGLSFNPDAFVTVTDDEGLPRKTRTIDAIELRKAKGLKCPPKTLLAQPNNSSQYWVPCPLGQKWKKDACKGKIKKYKISKVERACPLGFKVPTKEELNGLLSNLSDPKGDTVYWVNEKNVLKVFSPKTGESSLVTEKGSAFVRCIRNY